MIKKIFLEMIQFLNQAVIILSWILSILFLGYLALAYLLSYFLPNLHLKFNEKNLFGLSNFELGVFVGFSFLISLIGAFLQIRQKKINFLSIFKKSKEEMIVYAITAYFLGYFFAKTFLPFDRLDRFFTLILTILFFLLLSLLVDFYSNLPDLSYFKELLIFDKRRLNFADIRDDLLSNLNKLVERFILVRNNLLMNYKSTRSKGLSNFAVVKALIVIFFKKSKELLFNFLFRIKWKKIAEGFFEGITYLLFRLLVFLAIAVFFSGIIFLSIYKFYQYTEYKRKLREGFVITKITPKKTTFGEKVVLEGYNFGWWEQRWKDKLQTYFGSIEDIKEWTDNKIIFIVPFHLKEGRTEIWVERLIRDGEKNFIKKSNQVKLTIVSRWDFYPEEKEIEGEGFFMTRLIKKIKRMLFLNHE